MKRVGITTDCVCDLPEEYLALHDIDIVYFYITTATGRFRDGYEITSENIIEYLEKGGTKAETAEPTSGEYKDFFENSLKKYDEIIHICISSYVSGSVVNAKAALELMGDNGKRVHVIDSWHLSTGMGHMIIKAVEMRDGGSSADEIAAEMESMKKKVSSSFITRSADYLYRNGRAGKRVRDITEMFNLHPVLHMKDGKMTLKSIKTGNYDKAVLKYIKSELKHNRKINMKRLFITHACCSVKTIADVKLLAEKYCRFDEIIVTKASATVSGNCGPGAIGVLYVNE
ncbi:MAG: DegV family protein [Oscillospiraceae bacterium]